MAKSEKSWEMGNLRPKSRSEKSSSIEMKSFPLNKVYLMRIGGVRGKERGGEEGGGRVDGVKGVKRREKGRGKKKEENGGRRKVNN